MEFLKHLLIEGTKRWGGFAAVGCHLGMTQTDWHWAIETATTAAIDILLILGLYLEWKQIKQNENENGI